MGAGESVKFLANSPYIRDLAALVVGYGMAINIVEVSTYVLPTYFPYYPTSCYLLSSHLLSSLLSSAVILRYLSPHLISDLEAVLSTNYRTALSLLSSTPYPSKALSFSLSLCLCLGNQQKFEE